jgi:pimeloyl-ACP methyl ester carboxylesterase
MSMPLSGVSPGSEPPLRGHYLSRDGYRIHYVDRGAGDPLVMLHGNPTWSFLYRRFALALAGEYRVIIPDHAGCGLSDTPPEDRYRFTLKSRVDDLEALVDSLALADNLTLFLHDWGGLIGLGLAARRPKAIRRLVVFNTAGFLLPSGKRIHWTLRLCRRSRLATYFMLRWNAFARLAFRLGCPSEPMSRDVRRVYRLVCDKPERRRVTLRFVQDIPLDERDESYSEALRAQDALGRLGAIPTLILWGDRDFVFDADFLEEWRRRLPHAEVHRFPRAGHYAIEEEFDRMLPLVRDFLARHPVK